MFDLNTVYTSDIFSNGGGYGDGGIFLGTGYADNYDKDNGGGNGNGDLNNNNGGGDGGGSFGVLIGGFIDV